MISPALKALLGDLRGGVCIGIALALAVAILGGRVGFWAAAGNLALLLAVLFTEGCRPTEGETSLTPKTQALLFRFLLITGVIDLPIVSLQLQQPTFDWKLLLAGLLGGACAALEKSFGPQLADVYLPPRTNGPEPLTTVLTTPTPPPVMPPHTP